MPRRKALDVVLSDGTTLNISHREYWKLNSDFQKRVNPVSFMRIGDYHVAIGTNDFSSYYEETPHLSPPWKFSERDPNFRPWMIDSTRRDRLRQCSEIERAIGSFPSHPHAKQIQAAIAVERTEWQKVIVERGSRNAT